MTDQEQLENAIAHLENQRSVLGDAAVDAAIEGIKRKINDDGTVSSLKGERKLVTVMFADISGFTALSEKLDPEAVREIINACFDRLVPIIEKYEGTVEKFIGDEIMAFFGAPVAHENDPERALRTALEMMDELVTFNTDYNTNMGMHIGINTGLVIASGIGSEGREQYGVMGDTVNVAARLEDASEQGKIFVGPATYRLTANIFEFLALDPILVKGKAKPVHVYQLIGFKSIPRIIPGLGSREISSALVGRDAEVTQITDQIQELLAGRGGVLSIVGEAGVGKSRLLSEIRGAIDTDRLTWLEGRTLSFGQTISFLPFQGILWEFIGITEDDSEVATWNKLENVIATLFPDEMAEVLPYLATLLSIEVHGDYAERVKYLDGEAMSRQIFLVMRRFFKRLAIERPLVLVFEDLHWMDESSGLLLEHLLSVTEQVPLLLIGISRPYRETPAAHLQELVRQNLTARYNEINLLPLSQAQSTQLIQSLLTNDDLSTRVISMIARKAEGNPFFIEEIIRSLVDRGAVIYDQALYRWKATNLIDAITIPDTVQGVIMARVDRLDSPIKRVLSSAAAVGRSFLYRVLSAVENENRQLDDQLVELQSIELIYEKQQTPELEFIFKNALVQEAIYESILLQTRRELHKRVGQVIERLFEERLEEFYGVLAYHYARAEAWEKAQDYLLKAGDQAGRMAADSEALAHYQQAMLIFERAFGDEWDPVQRAVLERKVGEALFRRGEHMQALEYLKRALGFLRKPLPDTRLGVQLAIFLEILTQLGRHLLPRLLGLKSGIVLIDEPVDPAVEEEIHVYELIEWIEALRNQERFLLVALKLSNVSERKEYPFGVAVGATALGLVCDFIPAFWLAGIYHHRAMIIAEHMKHPSLLGMAYTGLNIHGSYLGEWDTAIETGRKAADTYQGTGNLHNQGEALYGLAANFGYMGDYPKALEYSRAAIRLGKEGNDLQVQCWGLLREGFSLQRQGQLNEAIMILSKAVELAKAISDYATQIEAGGELARCFLNQGDLEQALSILNEFQQVFVDHGAIGGTNTPLRNSLAAAYLMAVEHRKAIHVYNDDWLRKARNACKVALKQGKAFRPGMPDALRMQGTFEWLRGRHSAARKWWQRSLTLAVEQRQRYDLGMVFLEMGKRMDDRAHLERAEAIFAEIGAEWYLKQTRSLLEQIKDME